MVRIADTREPDAATHARYDEIYRDVYLPMYGRLRPLYRSLRSINGRART
jgi:sugar (pentulose or hexulose) kinase